jgi:hypothetical protein
MSEDIEKTSGSDQGSRTSDAVATTPVAIEKAPLPVPNLAGMMAAAEGKAQVGEILKLSSVVRDHIAHPYNWKPLKKWSIYIFYCFLQCFVTMTSTAYVRIAFEIQEEFGVNSQVVVRAIVDCKNL